MRQTNGKSPILFIFITILIDAIGMGLLIPVLPDVLRRFISDPVQVSEYFGYFVGLYALMQFLASPVLGSISDRFGRRPILLISLLGAGIDYVFMAFAPTLWLLFLGRLISGLTGASMTVASSYMADISTDENRSANFGMIGAAWGSGFILGPLLGGLLGAYGPIAPFIAAAALNSANFLFGVFVLPESLPREKRRNLELNRLNPFVSIFKVLKPSPFVILVWIYFLLFLAGQVHAVNWTLYTQMKFGWSATDVGLSLSFVGIIIALSQGLLTRVIIPKIGEESSLSLGIVFHVVTFALFGILTQGWMMYPVIALLALTGVTMPALQSIIARHVPASEQGELQGSLVSLGSFSSILAPMIFTPLFVAGTKQGSAFYFPGIAYLAAALISLFTLTIWLLSRAKKAAPVASELA